MPRVAFGPVTKHEAVSPAARASTGAAEAIGTAASSDNIDNNVVILFMLSVFILVSGYKYIHFSKKEKLLYPLKFLLPFFLSFSYNFSLLF